ncbi:MAG: phosphoribosyltransferase [Kiritimatiellia bacterium]
MEDESFEVAYKTPSAAIYKLKKSPIDAFVASTPGTRRICNDPTVAGIAYTEALKQACTDILRTLPLDLEEEETVVVNILRGGLNFGLRDALAHAYGWNAHTTSFISAQRARDDKESDAWHITENAYRKVYLPPRASFVIGDVVATGTSLRYGLQELVKAAQEQKIDVRSIVFFTYGGVQAELILAEIDKTCRDIFPSFEKTTLIYLEGRFAVAESSTPLHVRLTGTDLLRLGSLMAPEFVESQYENPSFPIERCIIYDAGSRAFWLYEYVADVIGYWNQNLQFAEQGMTFEQLLAERFPSLDPKRFPAVNLKTLCIERLQAMEKVIDRKKKQ